MSPVFLDTVGLLALWDSSDQWHKNAAEAFARFSSERRLLQTTSRVLMECGNAAARRPYRSTVCRLRDSLAAAELLVEPSGEEVEQAWANYRRGEAGQSGIVDHISFVVMRRLGITDVFTNDTHFRAAGFNPLF